MDFTKEQKEAITYKGSNVLVSAGAGSGKTQVLTARVIHFIKNEGYKLNQFLILTFTNLAAAEMKERIRKGLAKEGLKDAEEVDSASICTFDSYALNLVKKYHFLLKVSPNVSLIDGTIMDVRRRSILNEIFERLYKERDPEFTEMIEHFCLKSDENIRSLLLSLYHKAVLANDTEAYLTDFEKTYYNDALFDEIVSVITAKMCRLSDELKKSINEMPSSCYTKNKDNPMPQADYARDLFSVFFTANDYDSLISSWNNIDPMDYGGKTLQFSSSKWSDEVNLKTGAFKKALGGLEKFIGSLPKTKSELIAELEETRRYSRVFTAILLELDSKISEYKNSKGAYEFADIAKMASSLVRTNDDIREAIRSSLKMIMIDEYQDTSLLQDEFISYIADDNVYMVGDVKQSIYRFRDADVSIFIDKYKKYKSGEIGHVIDLNKNFRSRKEILDDINYIFKDLMKEDRGGADYQKDHIIESGNLDYPNFRGSSGHTDIFLYSLDEGEKPDPKIEADIIARDIINKMNDGYMVLEGTGEDAHLRPVQYKDFCILMDRGGAFNDYQKVFNDYKLPIFVQNNEEISTNEMVLVLSNILRMVKFITESNFKDPYFKKAWLSLARSFIFSYDDEKIYKIFNKEDLEHEYITATIRNSVFDNYLASPYEIFENLIFDLDIYGKCLRLGDIDRNHKYLDCFLSMFKSMSDLGYSLGDFISYLEHVDEYGLKIELTNTGTPIDSIRIMNIHKSKGLEFGIVYLSGIYKNFSVNDLNASYSVSSKYGLIMPKDPKKANVVKIVNADYESKESLSERIRQLYVALTRAKEQLIILVPMKDDAFTLLKTEDEKLFVDINPDIKFNTKMLSFYDMVVPYIDGPDFVLTEIDRNEDKPIIGDCPKSINHINLDVEETNIDWKEVEINRASKQLTLNASRKNLDFGTELHFLLETLDFVNPDYSSLSDEEKDVVANFLGSPLMKDVKLGKVYKEYEFFDESKGINGIIDLMIVYNDHIDIIDYKTKNIDDASYDKQVNIYMDFVSKAFGKKVKGYLYSLLDKNFRTVEKTIL